MTAPSIDPQRQVADLVVESPEFVQVFESVGIDYYCDGDSTLEEACARRDLDVAAIRERLRKVRGATQGPSRERGSSTDIIDDIVTTHHPYLREAIPSLNNLIQERCLTRADSNPALTDLHRSFLDLSADVRTHISKEEDDVFPLIEKLDKNQPLEGAEAAMLQEAITDLETNHESMATTLEQLSTTCSESPITDLSGDPIRDMVHRLETLERSIHLLIHKENNVLFPRAKRQLDRDEFELLVPFPTTHDSLLRSLDSTVEPLPRRDSKE